MSPDLPSTAATATQPANRPAGIKLFAVGHAGIGVAERLCADGLPAGSCVAVDTDAKALAGSSVPEKVLLETRLLRGLGSGGDPERAQATAEENAAAFKTLCGGADLVFIVAGLGGGAGTGVAPVLARVAREAGALVLGFVKIPFDCEGSQRRDLAREGLARLKEAADGVICLPNEKVFKLVDEHASVLETFSRTTEMLAEAVRAIWRLLTRPGLIEVHFPQFCQLLRDQHTESAFAVVEAMGATRSRDVLERLTTHPLLDGGQLLESCEAVLVSIMGGPDLTMAEVNRVMEQLNTRCSRAHLIMGATIAEELRERLEVTVIAARKRETPPEPPPARMAPAEGLDALLLSREAPPRPGSRFVPPAPQLTPDKMQQILSRQGATASRTRKAAPRMRQAQLPLEIVTKGRFDKSEPTIHKGQDLDVPTYIRRGVSLN